MNMSLLEIVHPKIWKRGNGDKEDIILYALSLKDDLGPSDFIREGDEPNKIKKTTFYKYFGKLLEKNYVDVKRDEKDRKKVNYFITSSGEIYLSKRSKDYGLDYETEHKIEMRRSKNQAERLKIFFQKNEIEDPQIQIEFLNLASTITFDKFYTFFGDEEKFNKLLLFLTFNHPKFYPEYSTSIEFFRDQYNSISESTLTIHEIGIFLERILSKKEKNIRFHKLILPSDGIILFFNEDSEYGRIFENTVDSHLKSFIHKTNLGIIEYKLEELAIVYQDIIITLVEKYKLFHSDAVNALRILIEDFRKEIKENVMKTPSKFIEYAKITELPEMPKSYKSIAVESKQKGGYYNAKEIDHQESVSSESFMKYSSSFKDVKYFSKDNLIKKAWELYEKRDYEGTLIQINKVLDVENNPELYYWKAEILRSMPFSAKKNTKSTSEFYEEALETIEMGIKLNPIPAGFNFYRLKADILFRMRNYDSALKVIEEALKIDNQEKIFEMKARILIKLTLFDESIKLYKLNLISKQFLFKQLKFEYQSLISSNEYERALVLINNALKLDPDNKNTLLFKSKALAYLNNNNDATKIVNELLRHKSTYKTISYFEYAEVLFLLKRYKEALAFSREVLAHEKYYINDYGPYIYQTHALILKELHLYEEALIAIEKFGSMDYDYFFIKIDILISLQRYNTALEVANTIIGYTTIDGSIKPEDYNEEVYKAFRKKIILLILMDNSENIVELLKHIGEKGLPLYLYAIKQLIEYDENELATKIFKSYYLYAVDSDDLPLRLLEISNEFYKEIVDQLNTGDYDKALILISQFSKITLPHPQIYKYKILAFQGLKKYDEALEITNEAIKMWPKSPSSLPWDLIGKEYTKEEEEAAVTYFYEFCRLKAKLLIIMGKKEEALNVIEKVIKLNPEIDDVYYFKMIILATSNEFGEALLQISKALQLNPREPTYYISKSRILHELKREDSALKTINKAIQLDSNDPYSYHFKAKILISKNKLNEALKTVDKGFKLFPDYLKFLEMRNLILHQLGRYSEAMDGIDNALEVGAKYSGIYYEKAQVLESLNKYDVALDTINNALEKNPDDQHSIVLKIRILNELEKFDEALNQLENKKVLITTDDSNSNSYNNLKARIYYKKAMAFVRNNMREDAINMIELALDLTNPAWADYTYKYGEIMMILRDYKIAAEKFESALKLARAPLNTKIKLGRCYIELGQYYEALHSLESEKFQANYGVKTSVQDEDGKTINVDLPQKELAEEATLLIKKIHSLLLNLKAPLVNTEIYFKIGDYYVSKGKYDISIEYFKHGKEIAIQRKETKWIEQGEYEIRRCNSFVEDFKRDLMR